LDWGTEGAPLLPLLGTFADKAWYAHGGPAAAHCVALRSK